MEGWFGRDMKAGLFEGFRLLRAPRWFDLAMPFPGCQRDERFGVRMLLFDTFAGDLLALRHPNEINPKLVAPSSVAITDLWT